MPLTLYILDTDDLRNCVKHGIPVNRCSECRVGYLVNLSRLCVPTPEVTRPCPS